MLLTISKEKLLELKNMNNKLPKEIKQPDRIDPICPDCKPEIKLTDTEVSKNYIEYSCPRCEGKFISYKREYLDKLNGVKTCKICYMAYKLGYPHICPTPTKSDAVYLQSSGRAERVVTAPNLLAKSSQHMADRAKTYDKPEGERSMGKTIQAFNIITGKELSEAEGWLLMQLLKDVRLFQRPGYHADSAEDCIAYSALKAEAKSSEAE